ncbi:ABC transporter substrate-binding protein [Rummeliibacillus stabekisii]|uniref:ABC transporter substrate-binding protein n=1 Tax=Rummeliibacillus stabekisii TaxID=241244 RepID=UPI00203FC34C|nr:ABC transporter substrate-binding protein [Rummeliibacillus stabekisii]MCM3318108.1 ABC transporter substrate-binding protein [Rummeliibacillus stabekisii]
MRKKFTKLIIPFAAASLLLAACGEQATNNSNNTSSGQSSKVASIKDESLKAASPDSVPAKALNRKDTFIATLSTNPGGAFLPNFYKTGYDGNVSSPIFDGLVDINEKGEYTPKLAEKWEISKDGKKYTFHIRKNAKFSDGKPVTSADVAFTLSILHDPSYAGDTDISRAHIIGGEDYKKGKAKTIKGIEIVDDQTITIKTDAVDVQALSILGGPVLSKAYYGKGYHFGNLDYLKDLYQKPMGAGPYKFDKYIPNQEVRYVANENYWNGAPKIKHFIYKIANENGLQYFQAGDVDFAGFTANADNLEQLKSVGFANIDIYTGTPISFISINNKKEYMKDAKVRQALNYGLNRQQIIDTVYQGYGEVANIPIAPVSWAYNDEGVRKFNYDPKKAKELLDEAGWKVGKNGIREKDGKKLELVYLSAKSDDGLIPIAKENYKEIGINLKPEFSDFNALVSKVDKGNYDLASFSTPMIMDPNDVVADYHSKNEDKNNGYKNPALDKLIEEGQNTLDQEKRKEIYHELYKEFADNPPIILLNYRKILNGVSSRIDGVKQDPYNGILSSLTEVDITK